MSLLKMLISYLHITKLCPFNVHNITLHTNSYLKLLLLKKIYLACIVIHTLKQQRIFLNLTSMKLPQVWKDKHNTFNSLAQYQKRPKINIISDIISFK